MTIHNQGLHMRQARGFTLIELMIVVAIIGILAALALPAYLDYAARTKVSEAATASAEARLAINLAFGDGSLSAAADNESLGLAKPSDIASRYVESVTAAGVNAASGTVTMLMRGTSNDGIDGKTVVYTITCSGGGNCRTAVGGTVEKKYLPKT